MINEFTWNFATNIIFRKEAQRQVGQESKRYGDRVLLIYSQKNEKGWNHQLVEQVKHSLSEQGIAYTELYGIKPNPEIDKVREGIALFRNFNAEFILAVGGGSVIDTAKAIASGVNYRGDVWDLFCQPKPLNNPPPIGVVLTMAAAGSEGSHGSVITNPATQEKYDIIDSALRPAFALLNPELTLTLPAFQTACGVVDILSHAMERYFTNTPDVELTDRLGEALMKTVLNNGYRLMKNSQDLSARSQIMWASTLAHNGLLDGGRASCWASHMIGTELSAKYDCAHGATLSVILPAWMKYIYKENIERFARFAHEVLDVEYNVFDLSETALKGIEQLEQFFDNMNMPTRLPQLGINDDSAFDVMAKSATRFGEIGCIKKLAYQDVVNIYRLAQ